MTLPQAKLVGAGVLALLAWLFGDRSSPAARVSKELIIDANVDSDTFGMTEEQLANHKRLVDLVDESSRAIADYDAAHPGEIGGLE